MAGGSLGGGRDGGDDGGAAASGTLPPSGFVKVSIRNLGKRSRVVPLKADGGSAVWNQVKHMPIVVPRSAAHPFGLLSVVLYGKTGVLGADGETLEDVELGSVLFQIHDVIKAQRVVGWFPLRSAHFVVGAVFLEMTFSYGLFGYGYSPQVVVPGGVSGPAAVRSSLLPRIEPPAKRSDVSGRATLVPTAVPPPPLLPVESTASIGYAAEMAPRVEALAQSSRWRHSFDKTSAAMTRLPHLMGALGNARSRQDRLSLLHALVTGPTSQLEGASFAMPGLGAGSTARAKQPRHSAAFAQYFTKVTRLGRDERNARRTSRASKTASQATSGSRLGRKDHGGGGGGGDTGWPGGAAAMGGAARLPSAHRNTTFHVVTSPEDGGHGGARGRTPALGALGSDGGWGHSVPAHVAAGVGDGDGGRSEAGGSGASSPLELSLVIPPAPKIGAVRKIVDPISPTESIVSGGRGAGSSRSSDGSDRDGDSNSSKADAAAAAAGDEGSQDNEDEDDVGTLIYSNDLLPKNKAAIDAAVRTAVAMSRGRRPLLADTPLSPRSSGNLGMSSRQRAQSSRQLMQMASGKYANQRRSSVSVMAEREVHQGDR